MAVLDVLREFLKLPHTAEAVLEKFAALPEAQYVKSRQADGFVYIPPVRSSALLLIAHADVYLANHMEKNKLEEDETAIRNPEGLLGADDRAGCALLWLFRRSVHGLLVTDGEETGLRGSRRLLMEYPQIRNAVRRSYPFLVEFDTRGNQQYKCYEIGSLAFKEYLEAKTGFTELEPFGSTDIRVLTGNHLCGVNFSCGYYNAHSHDEYIVKEEWLNTYRMAEKLLAEPEFPRFTR